MKVVKQLPDSQTHKNHYVPMYWKVLFNRKTGEIFFWSAKMAKDKENDWDTVVNPKAKEKGGKLLNEEFCKNNCSYLKELAKRDLTKNKNDETVMLRLQMIEYQKKIKALGLDPVTLQPLKEGIDSSDEEAVKERNSKLVKDLLPDEVMQKRYGDKVETGEEFVNIATSDDANFDKIEELEELETREQIDAFVLREFGFSSAGVSISDIRIVKAIKRVFNFEIDADELRDMLGIEEESEVVNDIQSEVDMTQLKFDDHSIGAEAVGDDDLAIQVAKMKKSDLFQLLEDKYNVDASVSKMNFLKLRSNCKFLVKGEINLETFLNSTGSVVIGAGV